MNKRRTRFRVNLSTKSSAIHTITQRISVGGCFLRKRIITTLGSQRLIIETILVLLDFFFFRQYGLSVNKVEAWGKRATT